ncbi:MAG TPA: ABC transporter permease [Candidatus Methylomirabilis sp.]|nr:ABC transporter permease [Candidatus Methylomirabilis sp.]
MDEKGKPGKGRGEGRRLWRTFVRNRAAVAGLVMAALAIILSVAAPLVTSHDPLAQEARFRLQSPDHTHFLGRDTFGRDVFARLLFAGRISLLVGVCSVLLGGVVGSAMGLVAGYVGGRVEHLIMRVVDTLMAFPSLLLGLLVLAVLGPGLFKMILAIGIMLSPAFARVMHGSALSLKKREFVEGARSVGAGPMRIVGRHILPNVLGEVVVLGSLWTASAIRIEANLSFIGLGVSPPTPTWGNMIRDGTPHLLNAPWLSVFPGLAILVAVLGFNLLGDGLRDVLDPHLRE